MKHQITALGFTLLELMIVIAILGVLAAMISGNFITSLKKGRDARRKGDLEQIQRALEMYYEDKRVYPTAVPGNTLSTQIIDPGTSGKIYMEKVPTDPSGGNYGYYYDSANNYYQLYACLENNQQILPYLSNNPNNAAPACGTNCFEPDGHTSTTCIWGISSPNTTP